jgi:hypothetical protein
VDLDPSPTSVAVPSPLEQVAIVLVFALVMTAAIWLLFRASRTSVRSSLLGQITNPLTAHLRASNDERAAVIAVLQRAWREGRLLDEEFERRHNNAQKAATREQLSELLRDLPATDGYRIHEGSRRLRDLR